MMKHDVLDPPSLCQYEAGQCTKIRAKLELQDAFFAYPSRPEHLSSQIQSAVVQIRDQNVCSVQDWRELTIGGRIIFCEICKAIRRSSVIVADLTTLNDNVIFEAGFAIGLGKRIWPIRDSSYEKDRKLLKSLGLLDYTGYHDFRSSGDIVTKFLVEKPWESKNPDDAYNHFYYEPHLDQSSRLFYLKSNHASDGSIELTSLVKKSRIPTTSVDPQENIQQSLRDYAKSVSTSLGAIVHMVDANRQDSAIHNARCALIAGLALAKAKPVLIVQEGETERPIDFGEIIRSYTNAKNIRLIFEHWIDETQRLHKKAQSETPPHREGRRTLAGLDLGELAAENEIEELDRYFVKTATYRALLNTNEAIVAGRKGTGKTALFYGIRKQYWARNRFFVLDLKPEGHQLNLFGSILDGFPGATKLYLIKSFWEYVILSELGRRILRDQSFAYQNEETVGLYKEIERSLNPLDLSWEGDFAQRLLELVNSLRARLENTSRDDTPARITQYLYRNDLHKLRDAIAKYLSYKEGTVILVDNLDKDWKPYQQLSVEIDILRSLLDSLRGLSNTLSRAGASVMSYVFIRNDILRLLHQRTPDKGKSNVVQLHWTDKQGLRQVIRERLEASSENPTASWEEFFSADCKGVDSFSYMLDRTLMRPRDLLTFCKLSIETALGRMHKKVEESDILHAEKEYSTRMLGSLTDEIKDVYGDLEACVLEFLDEENPLSESKVKSLLAAGLDRQGVGDVDGALEVLLEYGFLGIQTGPSEYAYSVDSADNLGKMKKRAEKLAKKDATERMFVVHPTFRAGLGIDD